MSRLSTADPEVVDPEVVASDPGPQNSASEPEPQSSGTGPGPRNFAEKTEALRKGCFNTPALIRLNLLSLVA